jgi:hypothetical protein
VPKARSRLKSSHYHPAPPVNLANSQPATRLKKHDRPSQHLAHYRQHLALLFLSLPFYLIVGTILTRVQPESIAHLFIPSAYLPLQLPLFLANFFLFSFIFLNSRRGLLISLLVSTLLFLKLQQVIFETGWVIGLVVAFAMVELTAVMIGHVISRRQPKSARPTKRVRFEARHQPGK